MVLSSSDAVTLSELSGRKSVMKILRTLKQTDPETRRLILRGFALLTRSAREHLPAALRRAPEQNGQTGQAEECAQACTCAAEEKTAQRAALRIKNSACCAAFGQITAANVNRM